MSKYTNNGYIVQKKGEYEPKFAWDTAIGLQDVDGIEVSTYLRDVAKKHIDGEIDYEKVESLICDYYSDSKETEETKTADLVALRIAGILSEQTYSFYPGRLNSIHKELFDGIYSFAGQFREYNISKSE